MKLLDFLQLPIVQLLRKFHPNISTNEGEGDNVLGLTLIIASPQISIIAQKVAKFQYFADFFCSVLLFDIFHYNYHFQMKIVFQIHLFKIRGAKTEVFCCLRCCIFEAKILFCVQSLVSK